MHYSVVEQKTENSKQKIVSAFRNEVTDYVSLFFDKYLTPPRQPAAATPPKRGFLKIIKQKIVEQKIVEQKIENSEYF
jgi:hypothetical protein